VTARYIEELRQAALEPWLRERIEVRRIATQRALGEG
jgi:hypothetical protein